MGPEEFFKNMFSEFTGLKKDFHTQKEEMTLHYFLSKFVSKNKDQLISRKKVNHYLGFNLYTKEYSIHSVVTCLRLLMFTAFQREDVPQSDPYFQKYLEETDSIQEED